MCTHYLCSEQKYEEYQNFWSENFHSFGGKIYFVFSQRLTRKNSYLDILLI